MFLKNQKETLKVKLMTMTFVPSLTGWNQCTLYATWRKEKQKPCCLAPRKGSKISHWTANTTSTLYLTPQPINILVWSLTKLWHYVITSSLRTKRHQVDSICLNVFAIIWPLTLWSSFTNVWFYQFLRIVRYSPTSSRSRFQIREESLRYYI